MNSDDNGPSRSGPLAGIRVIEFAGLGPAPFAAMLLADLGADVIRVDRPGAPKEMVLARGKRSIALDLKSPADLAIAARLAGRAELLIEGFRPGVMEKLGLGPDELLRLNPRLVYGRMTGWGQTGPLAQVAGHDINYIAITGALHPIGPADAPPPPPLNLVGDFGGGSLYLIMGLLSALIHARATGQGQVVDAAMTDGSASLVGLFHGLLRDGRWQDRRGVNFLDGAAPFYRCYACSDGKWIAVGAIEAQFWALLRTKLGLDDPMFDDQWDRSLWPAMSQAIAAIMLSRTRDEWAQSLEGCDACVAPVLSLAEAPHHAHNAARQTFEPVPGGFDAAPAPRFSVTGPRVSGPPPATGADGADIMKDWLE